MTRPTIGGGEDGDVMGWLRELAELRREGLLSAEEFARAKAKLLE